MDKPCIEYKQGRTWIELGQIMDRTKREQVTDKEQTGQGDMGKRGHGAGTGHVEGNKYLTSTSLYVFNLFFQQGSVLK